MYIAMTQTLREMAVQYTLNNCSIQESRLEVLNRVESEFPTLVRNSEDETMEFGDRKSRLPRMFERDICVHHERGRCEMIPGGNDRIISRSEYTMVAQDVDM